MLVIKRLQLKCCHSAQRSQIKPAKYTVTAVIYGFVDAMHKRGLCRRAVSIRPSVCLGVRHVRVFCRDK